MTRSKEFCTTNAIPSTSRFFLVLINLAPFFTANLEGLEWLNQRFHCETPGQQSELVEIWRNFLTQDIIFTGTTLKDLRFYPYQPHIFTRQFGLSQLPQAPIQRKKIRPNQLTGEESLIPKVIRNEIPKVKLQFQPSSFKNYFLSTQDFHSLWTNYNSQRICSKLSSQLLDYWPTCFLIKLVKILFMALTWPFA